MSSPVDVPDLPPEVEELLWADRFATAELWEPEPGIDADLGVKGWAEAIGADGSPIGRHIAAGFHLEDLLREWEHATEQATRWEGVQTRILAEALDLALRDGTAGSDAAMSVRSIAAELGCVVGVTDRTIQQRMADAADLRDRFTATFTALREGRLSRRHTQVVLDEGARLVDTAVRAEYEKLVLARAGGLTTGRLRAVASAIAEQLDPESIIDRHARARARRGVFLRDGVDGMGELNLIGPAVLVHGIYDRLTQQARSVKEAAATAARAEAVRAATAAPARTAAARRADADADAADRADIGADAVGAVPADTRTLDQLRADILCDLALTSPSTVTGMDRDSIDVYDAFRPIVQITIPADTLTGASDAAATLNGRIPIDPDTARRLAGAATLWHRVLTDPCTGNILAVDRRFPTEAQRRVLRARDEHCRFPGCRQAVWRCDIDHTVDHQHGGATDIGNLAHLCRGHHTLKHESPWTVEQHGGGVLTWVSPLGKVYTDHPPPTLRFLPDPSTRAVPGSPHRSLSPPKRRRSAMRGQDLPTGR